MVSHVSSGGASWRGRWGWVWTALGAGLAGGLLTRRGLLGIPCALIAGWLAWTYRRSALRHRRQLLQRQFAEGLALLAQLLRAGSSLPQAVEHWAKEAPTPLHLYLQQVVQELRLGVSLPEVTSRWAVQVRDPEVELFAAAVALAWEGGGATARMFTSIAEMTRERQRIAGRVASLTAQGRLSGYVMAVLPFVVLGMLHLMAPELVVPLWQTTVGNLLLLVVAVLVVAGLVLMDRLVESEA